MKLEHENEREFCFGTLLSLALGGMAVWRTSGQLRSRMSLRFLPFSFLFCK